MENIITKEYFEGYLDASFQKFEERLDKKLDEKLAPLATKEDLREAVEELARITSQGFDDIKERLDVREDVINLNADMHLVKQILEID